MPLVEADVVKAGVDFMVRHGWRAFRNQSGKFSAAGGFIVQVGEPGIPDWKFVYYVRPEPGAENVGQTYTVWIEYKRPGHVDKCRCTPAIGRKRAKTCTICHQKAWREAERARGALCIRVSAIEAQIAWYAKRFAFLHPGVELQPPAEQTTIEYMPEEKESRWEWKK